MAFVYYGVIIAIGIIFSANQDMDNNEDDNNIHGKALYDFDYSAIFISASSEIFGLIVVLYTIDRYGRIATQTVAYLLGGGSFLLLSLAVSPEAHRSWLIALSFFTRMAMMAAFCTTWVSTSELFSTKIRATGHGVSNAMARLGGFVCPYIISERTPIIYVGWCIFAACIVVASVSWHLPETAGQSLGNEQEKSNTGRSQRSTRLCTCYMLATNFFSLMNFCDKTMCSVGPSIFRRMR
jgi:MFS family permease